MPNIVEELKKPSFSVLHVGKDIVSTQKQKTQDFMKHFGALHRKPELCKDCGPQKNWPKRLSKRARKALKNASPVVVKQWENLNLWFELCPTSLLGWRPNNLTTTVRCQGDFVRPNRLVKVSARPLLF